MKICDINFEEYCKKYSLFYKNSEKMNNLIIKNGKTYNENFIDGLCNLINNLDIDLANGYFLDRIGDFISYERPLITVLDDDFAYFDTNFFDTSYFKDTGTSSVTKIEDELYRKLIKLKILNTVLSNSIENLNEKVKFAFGESSVVIDNGDMSITYQINNLNDAELQIIAIEDILPIPIGVNLANIFTSLFFFDTDYFDTAFFGV